LETSTIFNMSVEKDKYDNVFVKAYKEYRLSPLPNISNHHNNELLNNGWCVQIGMSIMAPHPHRHYNFDEFMKKLKEDKKFADRFILNRFSKL
jgi:hypothetical protein